MPSWASFTKITIVHLDDKFVTVVLPKPGEGSVLSVFAAV